MERTPAFQVQSFGSYFLLERIAVGGMAEIFKAKQFGVRGFEKIVVIKKILHHLGEDPEFVEMFEDEARIAAQLTQANIVQIYELGEADGTLYIVMEYIEGKNLRDITRNVTAKHFHLSIDQVIYIMIEILKGLDYAHRKSDSQGKPLEIVHRDMSPQNVIVSYEGEVKILDFGIAKAASRLSKTEAGVLKGKFSYMSPEQAGGKSIDQRSDIYACGVMAHELLTSERLFRAKTDMETLERVKEGQVAPPSQKNPQIDAELDHIILKALAKDLRQRYQTTSEFLGDLSRYSVQSGYTYSSQDLGAFMKTLFATTIQEEKIRLVEAEIQIPQAAADPILNARTRVAFKADIKSEGQKLTDTAAQPEITFTISQKTSKIRNRFILTGILGILVIGGLGFWIFNSRNNASHSAIEPNEIIFPTEPVNQNHDPTSSSKPESSGKVESFLGNVETDEKKIPPEEMATEIVPEPKDTPIHKPHAIKRTPSISKPRPSSEKSSPRSLVDGKLNVVAPPEGFAELYVDGKSMGTVPGPKARGISLIEGHHQIVCKTKSREYKGSVKILPEQETTIRCGELTK